MPAHFWRKDSTNEHVEAQRIAPHKTLDFNNIVASCRATDQCDLAHGSQPLPLTPLMSECETELRFKINGRIEGITERARQAIKVLNLGDHELSNKSLVYKRKRVFESILLINQLEKCDRPSIIFDNHDIPARLII